ncbi:hypothetical protein ACFL2H_05990 [Planctomycetota bacterium]
MTDKSKEQYRLASSEQQKRVGEFADVEDSTSRKNEIAICRTLIEDALQKGNVSLANSLLNTLDRIQKSEFRRQLIENELLTKPSVRRFMLSLVDVMATVVARHYPEGWEDCLAEISTEIEICFLELANDAKSLEKVKLPR